MSESYSILRKTRELNGNGSSIPLEWFSGFFRWLLIDSCRKNRKSIEIHWKISETFPVRIMWKLVEPSVSHPISVTWKSVNEVWYIHHVLSTRLFVSIYEYYQAYFVLRENKEKIWDNNASYVNLLRISYDNEKVTARISLKGNQICLNIPGRWFRKQYSENFREKPSGNGPFLARTCRKMPGIRPKKPDARIRALVLTGFCQIRLVFFDLGFSFIQRNLIFVYR